MQIKDSKKNKKIILGIALALGVILGGIGTVYADTTVTGKNHMSGLIDALATKFNLNRADVEKVVTETMQQQHEEMEAQHEQMLSQRLADAVTKGTITQAQADLIKAKQAELKTFRDSLAGKTPEEQKALLNAQMTSLKQWATDNNIPTQLLMFVGGKMGHGGPRGMKGGFMMGTSTPSMF